jgi:alkylation response protein AidB-like acyl-CoA dehydrogenase
MDFRFSEKEENLRKEIRRFVKENLPPDHFLHLYSEEHDDEDWELSMSISKKLAARKWLTISWPPEYGGLGATAMERLVFMEEAGYWGIPGTKMGVSGTVWVGPTLMLLGTEEQKAKYLPPIAAGDPDGVWCTGYSEPDSGSDLASLQTSAVRDGDDYIVNGQKVWTSAAHRARWLWLACRTEQNVQKKHHGLSIIIVDMKSEGVTVRPIKNYYGFHFFNEIVLRDVRVPVKNLVGVENNGWRHLMQALNFERGSAVFDSGAARRIRDELLQYAKATGQIRKPAIRRSFADLSLDIASARILAYEAVWKISRGEAATYEASRDKANMDVLFHKLSEVGMEILGGFSMMDPLYKGSKWTKLRGMIEHVYYSSPGKATAAGSTFTQRNISGQFGLGLPRSY